ncbi:hypothetical protein BV509_12830 [Rhodovulum sulfidophilum]|nr:hypothetical protein BV509_12830 [Rhodovulum sulfidophilum]
MSRVTPRQTSAGRIGSGPVKAVRGGGPCAGVLAALCRALAVWAMVTAWAAGAASGAAVARCDGLREPGFLDLGVAHAPPFVILEDGAPPTGLSVELWRRVETGLIEAGRIEGSHFVICDAIEQQERALTDGGLDLVLAPLTITPERLLSYGFSRQYFLSGLTIAARHSNEIAFSHALEVLVTTLFQPGTLRAVVLFLVLNLVLAVMIKWVLRDARRRPEEDRAPPGRLLTLVDPYLEAVERTLGLKGIGDAGFNLAGRALEMFMAIIGTALSAALLGVLTSAFVSAIGQSDRVDELDLTDERVGIESHSTAQEFLADAYEAAAGKPDDPECRPLSAAPLAGPGCVTEVSADKLLEALVADEVDRVIGDWAELTYLAGTGRFRGKVTVEQKVYRSEPLGWGYGSALTQDLRARIDSALIQQIRHGGWRRLAQRYLGSGSIAPD